jgi:hypothetical protein
MRSGSNGGDLPAARRDAHVRHRPCCLPSGL